MVHLPPDSSREQFYKYQLVNTEGTEKLARSAAISGAKRFVFVSTIKVNGEGKADSYNEKDIPDPKDPYGVSKWEAEKRLKTVSCETGLDVVIIRSPLVYGPGVKANFLKLMKMIDREIPMPFQGVINRRSFIYIYNLTDLIIECLKHPKAAGKTYLVSDGEDVSTTDLLKYIAASLERNSRLFYCPLSIIRFIGKITGYSEEIKRLTESLSVDSSLVRKELNWTPPFDLIQGLKETADWYKKEFHTK
jgi:nucleoside-diphosphate-sugar epimerase